MGRIGEVVAVLVDLEGAPTIFSWREKDYQVISRQVRCFARAEWLEPEGLEGPENNTQTLLYELTQGSD